MRVFYSSSSNKQKDRRRQGANTHTKSNKKQKRVEASSRHIDHRTCPIWILFTSNQAGGKKLRTKSLQHIKEGVCVRARLKAEISSL